MSGTPRKPDEPEQYEIRVRGHLDDRWAARFPELSLTRLADGTTRLSGRVLDQAALHAWLRRVRDLGLPLVSVRVAVPGSAPDEEEVGP